VLNDSLGELFALGSCPSSDRNSVTQVQYGHVPSTKATVKRYGKARSIERYALCGI